ncbi:hypothetical protein BDAP_002487 [Binucleata daphniae]
MNIFLYCIKVLQTLLYTANIETVKDETKVNKHQVNEQSKILTDKFEEYYQHFQAVTKKNVQHKELYDAIVEAFCFKFCNVDDFIGNIVYMSLILPSWYDINTIERYCNRVKKENMEKKGISDDDLDFEFTCAYNMFVDTSSFIMDTFIEIHEMRGKYEDIEKLRREISKNTELLEKYILSVNWLTRLFGKKKKKTRLYL